MSSTTIVRRGDIDGLRGIAVSAVLVYHFWPDAMPGGLLGVDVFFVISGFVITNLLITKQTRSASDLRFFWANRIRRLFPSLVLVLATTLIAGFFWLWSTQYAQLAESSAWSSVMAANIYFFLETGYFEPAAETVPLLNLWSLGVEEQFYLAWPLLMAWLMPRSRRFQFATVVSLGALSWASALVYVEFALDQNSALAATFYLPHFRAWELCLGAALAIGDGVPTPMDRWLGQGQRGTLLASASIAVLVGCFVLTPQSANPSTYALPSVLATAALIRIGSIVPHSTRAIGNRLLLWLGATSYPLYLWHYPVLAFSHALGIEHTLVNTLGLVLLSLVLGDLTWRLVERPIRKRSITPALLMSLVIPLGLLFMASVEVNESSGFPGRGGSFGREFASFRYDAETAGQDNRAGRCWINDGIGKESIEAVTDCVVVDDDKWNVLLWGDSYGATLYVGLAESIDDGMTLSQVTADSCFPEYGREVSAGPACTHVTNVVGDLIRSGQIDEVIISNHWRESASGPIPRIIEWILRDSDVEVLLVGPFPEWSPHLPDIIFANREIPIHLVEGSVTKETLNGEFISISQRFGVKYFDMLDLMCNENGCLGTIDGSASTITTFDHGHLTRSSSVFAGERIASLLGPRP